MGKRRLIISNVLIILFLLSGMAFLYFYGLSGRVYLDKALVKRVERPESSYFLWRESGIKGRVLFLFDRHIHDVATGEEVNEWNYIYKAMRNNFVRKVYHVVPDSAWNDVSAVLGKSERAERVGDGFRFVIEGMPVMVMRIKDVTAVGEKVLIDVNADWWGGDDLIKVAQLVKDRALQSDLITVSGGSPEIGLEMFGLVDAKPGY